VSPAEWRVALAQLEVAARGLLLGCEVPALRAGGAGAAVSLAAYTSGLGPWLGWYAEQGRLQADSVVGTVLALHLEHGRRRWQRLDDALRLTLERLSASGVSATVLKGAHLARYCFEEPGLRPMADLDVYVGSARIDAAEAALAAAGYEELADSRLPLPRRSGWRPPGAPVGVRSLWLVHADDGYAVDLHGTLDIDFFGVRTVGFGEPEAGRLAARRGSDSAPERSRPEAARPDQRAPAGRGGGSAPERAPAGPGLPEGTTVLAQPLLAAHCAVHAGHGLHGLTLIRLVELALLLRRDYGSAGDWSALAELLHSLGAAGFAYPAFALTEKLAPGTMPPAFLSACGRAAPARLRRLTDSLTPAGAQRPDELALGERFLWGSGPADHLRRVGNMLLPGGERGSWRALARLYRERTYRLLRGRVRW
jgi:hypothetical protein